MSATSYINGFARGAAVLSIGVFLVKILGAIYKIPLTNMVGEMGMGYFNTAYQLYLPIYTIASAGFPAAIARFVSQNISQGNILGARDVYRKSIPFFVCSGMVGMGIMLFGAPFYANFVGSPDAAHSIRALAPTVLFCCVMSALRGYYNGLCNMLPTAISQVTEAAGRLFLGLSGAWIMLNKCKTSYELTGMVFGQAVESEMEALQITLSYAAAAAVFGVTVGAFLGLLYLFCYDIRKTPRSLRIRTQKSEITTRCLAKVALPICAGALIVNVGSVMDVTLLQIRLAVIPPEILKKQFIHQLPNTLLNNDIVPFLYGSFTMAQNLAALVPTLAQAIGTSALPGIAAVAAQNSTDALRDAMEDVLRLTAFIAFPAGLGLCVFAKPLLQLLYEARPFGAQIAAQPLMLLGVASVFVTLSVPIFSMLQAIGKERIPVLLLLIGFALKFVVDYKMIAMPQYHLLGACIGTLLCYIPVTLLGLWCLQRYSHCKIRFGMNFGGILAAAFLGVFTARAVYTVLVKIIGVQAVIPAIGVAMIIYGAVIVFGRVLRRRDVEVLPSGKKIAQILEKHGWIR